MCRHFGDEINKHTLHENIQLFYHIEIDLKAIFESHVLTIIDILVNIDKWWRALFDRVYLNIWE